MLVGRGDRIRTCVHRFKAGCLRPLDYTSMERIGSPRWARSTDRRLYEGAALPLSYRTVVWSPRSESNGHALRAPVSETGASAYSATRGCAGASPGARTLTRRVKSPVLCRSSSRRLEVACAWG